jgi:AcrR family transcriptional regulator
MTDDKAPSDLPAASKDRILHAAEQEFTTKGFNGASTRDIAATAGVAQALIHYHFNSKRALFLAMVQRRAHISCMAWETALAQLPEPELRGILEAVFRPVLDDKSGGVAYLRVLTMLAKGSAEDRALLSTLFDPTGMLFIEAIRLAEPELGVAAAANGFRFSLGVLASLLSESERSGRLGGMLADDAAEADLNQAVTFCAAGIRALV